jgi:hypothetical protein
VSPYLPFVWNIDKIIRIYFFISLGPLRRGIKGEVPKEMSMDVTFPASERNMFIVKRLGPFFILVGEYYGFW